MHPNIKWRNNNPEKHSAHMKLAWAVRKGRIRPLPCQWCGETERIHGHHEDYSKPYEVIWLCSRCHRKLHALKQGQSIGQVLKRKRTYKYKPRFRPRKEPRPGRTVFMPSPKRDAMGSDAERLRNEGKSYKEIARALNVSKGTVYKWLNNTAYN